MKKLLSLLLVVLTVFSLSACSAKKTDGDVTDNGSTDVSETEKIEIRNHNETVAVGNGQTVIVLENGVLRVSSAENEQWYTGRYIKDPATGEVYWDSGVFNPAMQGYTAVAVDAASDYNLVLTVDRSLWYWGKAASIRDPRISLSAEEYFEPVKILDDVATFSAGEGHILAVKTDGSVWGLGENIYKEVTWESDEKYIYEPVKIMDGCLAVAAGIDQSYVIKEDGTLLGWGHNDPKYCELGCADIDNSSDPVSEPVKIMDDVVFVEAGASCAYAITSDNTLWGWGSNEAGQICNGIQTIQTPVKIMEDVQTVSSNAFGGYCIAVKTDGTTWGWGSVKNGNSLGMDPGEYVSGVPFGDSTSYYNTDLKCVFGPIQLPMSNICMVSAGNDHTVLVDNNGEMYFCGNTDNLANMYPEYADIKYCSDDIMGPVAGKILIP